MVLPEDFIVYIEGALLELTYLHNWEQYGTLTPTQCQRAMIDAILTTAYSGGLRDSLRAWWDLSEVSGSRADSLGVSTLTDNNTVGNTSGLLGNAAQFVRSASEYLSIADNVLFSQGNANLSIVAWVRLDNKTNSQRIFGKWNTVGNKREYLLQYNLSTDRFNFSASGDGTANENINAQVLGSPSINTWYMVTCRHDADNDEISVGVNTASPTALRYTAGIYNGTEPFTLSNPTVGLDGALSSVAIWDRILSQSEVVRLYNAGIGMLYSNLELGGV